jgi:hypothetical protein
MKIVLFGFALISVAFAVDYPDMVIVNGQPKWYCPYSQPQEGPPAPSEPTPKQPMRGLIVDEIPGPKATSFEQMTPTFDAPIFIFFCYFFLSKSYGRKKFEA